MPFSGHALKTEHLKKEKKSVGYVYIRESTIFNMGYGLWVGKIAHGRKG